MKSEKEAFTDRMLHIILLILKIIGIVLLCILGFLILSVLCGLFVPVRYRIKVSREEGEGKPPVTAHVRITWLLHLVNILVRYPAEVIVRVRIFVFTIFRIPVKERKTKDTGRKKKNRKKRKQPNEPENETGAENESSQDDEVEAGNEETVIDDGFTPSLTGSTDSLTPQDSVPEPGEDGEGSSEDDGGFSLFRMIRKCIEKIKGIIEKIKYAVDKIKAFFENIQYTIRKFCDKIRFTLDNIQYYREVLESDSFKRSLELSKRELGYVFRKLKPDKFEADLSVGMDDPAATGQILALYGMLYPLIGQHVRLVGDFACEGTHIEGELYIQGRIRAYTFLRVLIRVYRNKDIRRLINLLKKEAV